jgi:hypothetical protein
MPRPTFSPGVHTDSSFARERPQSNRKSFSATPALMVSGSVERALASGVASAISEKATRTNVATTFARFGMTAPPWGRRDTLCGSATHRPWQFPTPKSGTGTWRRSPSLTGYVSLPAEPGGWLSGSDRPLRWPTEGKPRAGALLAAIGCRSSPPRSMRYGLPRQAPIASGSGEAWAGPRRPYGLFLRQAGMARPLGDRACHSKVLAIPQ